MFRDTIIQKHLNLRAVNRVCVSLTTIFAWLLLSIGASVAHAQSSIALPDDCSTSVDATTGRVEEIKIICQPEQWNNILVVYAHGYVAPGSPIQISDDTVQAALILLPDLLANGFAFATTSYRKNGYAVERAENDINALVDNYPGGKPETVLLVGASEGALIITGLIEKYEDRYDGGLALCGPLAGANYAVQYFGDFRVVFDYLFPEHPTDGLPVFFTDAANPMTSQFGVIPPKKGDQFWQENWESGINYEGRIKETILDDLNNNNGHQVEQLFNIVRVAMPDSDDPEYADLAAEAASGVLSYDIRGFNDLGETAGGDPYGNKRRWYWGSDNDWLLNLQVERVASDRGARSYLRKYYDPKGNLSAPLVTVHTSDDPTVPARNQFIYQLKTLVRGSADKLDSIPVERYGHCTFQPQEALGAFGLLLSKIGIPVPNQLEINRAQLPASP